MSELDALRKDLDLLLKDLQAARSDIPASADSRTAAEPGKAEAALPDEDLLKPLHELTDYLTSRATETEAVVAGHPFVTIAAAFILGLAVGRISHR